MTAELRQAIAARLKAARLRAGLSQEALATSVKRTPESISNIERAQQLPALDTLLELAEVLELPPLELLSLPTKTAAKRKVSAQRALAEAQIAEVTRGLSDTAVSIALEQIRALAAVK